MSRPTSALTKLFLGAIFAITALWASPASAERRVALLVGNSAYASSSKLANPLNDVATMAELLRKAEFDVVVAEENLDQTGFRRALREFQDKTEGAEIGLIFYSGHGIEVGGQNYLLPVDARIRTEIDVEDQGIRLDRVLRALDGVTRLKLVFLDACRDNPFLSGIPSIGGRKNVTRGLARVEPASSDTLIAYAAKAGTTADDGAGFNSPFTAALSRHLTRPGLDIRIALGYVRDDVLKATGQRQEPFTYGSLGGDVPLLVRATVETSPVPATISPPPPAVVPPVGATVDEIMWSSIKDHPTTDFLRIFIARFPLSPHRREAENELGRLTREERPILDPKSSTPEIVRQLVGELRARGCYRGASDLWGAEAQAALDLWNGDLRWRNSGPTLESLESVKTLGHVRCQQYAAIYEPPPVVAYPPDVPVFVPSTQPEAADPTIELGVLRELKRIGCYDGDTGRWSASGASGLELYNRHARKGFRTASLEALQTLRGQTSRVCPLVCSTGQKAQGDRCVAIECPAGSRLEGDSCKRTPALRRAPTVAAKPAESGGGRGKCFTFNGSRICE